MWEDLLQQKQQAPLSQSALQAFTQQLLFHHSETLDISGKTLLQQPFDLEESQTLIRALRDSGEVLNWQKIADHAPVLDKHSTGGVGDIVSLVFAPLIASCGGYVPMIARRSLGYVGGTLDKLESISGFSSKTTTKALTHIVKNVGCAIIGQTENLAPATQPLLYGGLPLSPSLLSNAIIAQKLATGLNYFVMDIKVRPHDPQFDDRASAQRLALDLLARLQGQPLQASVILSDHRQVISSSIGNSLELIEAVKLLRGDKVSAHLKELVLAICGQALWDTKLADSLEEGKRKIQEAISSGRAAERFNHMILAQDGPDGFCNTYKSHLRKAAYVKPVFSEQEGYVSAMDVCMASQALIALGGGRYHLHDEIDHSVGLSELVPLNTRVDSQTPLAMIHAQNEDDWQLAAKIYRESLTITESAPQLDQAMVLDILKP
ncbi:MAG: thymidine phosphorylase [Cardiobacteriaceae bacterium]|nr:thymidine phosphorylase [Cardiobacteriaceae bacterium]